MECTFVKRGTTTPVRLTDVNKRLLEAQQHYAGETGGLRMLDHYLSLKAKWKEEEESVATVPTPTSITAPPPPLPAAPHTMLEIVGEDVCILGKTARAALKRKGMDTLSTMLKEHSKDQWRMFTVKQWFANLGGDTHRVTLLQYLERSVDADVMKAVLDELEKPDEPENEPQPEPTLEPEPMIMDEEPEVETVKVTSEVLQRAFESALQVADGWIVPHQNTESTFAFKLCPSVRYSSYLLNAKGEVRITQGRVFAPCIWPRFHGGMTVGFAILLFEGKFGLISGAPLQRAATDHSGGAVIRAFDYAGVIDSGGKQGLHPGPRLTATTLTDKEQYRLLPKIRIMLQSRRGAKTGVSASAKIAVHPKAGIAK